LEDRVRDRARRLGRRRRNGVRRYRYDRSAADRILPGVSIEGVDVSDMSRSQALREVTAKAQETLGASLTVEAAGRSWIVTRPRARDDRGVEDAVNGRSRSPTGCPS
jgi:hypothetical protein